MTNERLYTTKEVAKILSISDYRPKDGIKRGVLVPTDINPSVGRNGQYLFNADAIRKYAAVLKITPNFAVVGANQEDEINEDGSITLTPENFNRIVHGGDPVEAHTDEKDIGSNKDIWNMFRNEYSFSIDSIAYVMDIKTQSLRNIISRDTVIKLDQLVDICTAANLEIKIGDHTINPKKWYADDPAKYEKLNGYMTKRKEEAYKEYEAAKARVAELEKELGIK